MFLSLSVQVCVDGDEGGQLLADYGVEQNSQTPVPNNVPWSNFDSQHMAEYWEIEQIGLLNYVCNTFQLPSC